VALPLLPEQAARIIGVAEAAPYGRGEETVVDPAVRRCWQISPDRVRHRQLVVDGIAEGAIGWVAAGDRRDYVAIATLVASAHVVNA